MLHWVLKSRSVCHGVAVLATLCLLAVAQAQTTRSYQEIRDLAALASAAYESGAEIPADAGYVQVEHNDTAESGLKYGVYQRVRNGEVETVLAFAGTDGADLPDVATDGFQALNPTLRVSDQYAEALAVAARVARDYGDYQITGHSLGGGLSQYVSVATGREATVFNAAGLGRGSIRQLDRLAPGGVDGAGGQITNVHLIGDVVSGGPTSFNQLGTRIELEPAPGTVLPLIDRTFLNSFFTPAIINREQNNLRSTVQRHLQGNVIAAAQTNRAIADIWTQQRGLRAFDQDRLLALDAVVAGTEDFASFSIDAQVAIREAQLDNLQRFQVGALTNAAAFSFTSPMSTGGFIDVTVPSDADFTVRLFDSGALEDGDMVAVTIASGSGVEDLGTVSLTFAGQNFTRDIASGAVELRLRALNEGTSSPNTGGVNILSPIIAGPSNQNFNLNTGETGVLRVFAR